MLAVTSLTPPATLQRLQAVLVRALDRQAFTLGQLQAVRAYLAGPAAALLDEAIAHEAHSQTRLLHTILYQEALMSNRAQVTETPPSPEEQIAAKLRNLQLLGSLSSSIPS